MTPHDRKAGPRRMAKRKAIRRVSLETGPRRQPQEQEEAAQDPPVPEDDACLTMLARRLAMCAIGREVAQLPNCAG
jgi:hypothetical protein